MDLPQFWCFGLRSVAPLNLAPNPDAREASVQCMSKCRARRLAPR